MKYNVLALFAIFSVFLLFGCTAITGQPQNTATSSGGSAYDTSNIVSAPSSAPAPSSLDARDLSAKQVIKTGYATIEVPVGQLDAKLAQLKTIIAADGGQVDSMSYYESDATKQYDVTARVTPAIFDSITDKLRPLGTLKSMNTNSQDVTLQYTDLQARIDNLKVEEGRLLELYNKSDNVSDIIAVEQQLASVQTELESDISQKNYLDNQITLSTITITLQEAAPVVPANPFVPLSDIVAAFLGALGMGIVVLAGLAGFAIPVIIVLAILFVVAKQAWNYWKNRKAGTKKK